MKTILTIIGAMLAYAGISFFIEGSVFGNPIEIIEGIAFAVAFGAGVPVFLAILLGVGIVGGLMALGGYVLRAVFTKKKI